MIKIGLYGIGGLNNFGCEAIVRGIYSQVKLIQPNSKLFYFSRNLPYDSQAIEDLDIECIDVNAPCNMLRRRLNAVFAKFYIQARFRLDDVPIILNKVDILLSIGGDIYTIPQRELLNAKYPYYNHLAHMSEKIANKKLPIIMMGASLGPFGSYVKAKRYYSHHLSYLTWIFCREQRTIKYLEKEFGFNNCSFLPDPAFFVEKVFMNNPEFNKTKEIGINLSPLSYNEISGDLSKDTEKRLAVLIEAIALKFKRRIILIPHVNSKWAGDNDWVFMQKILKEIKPSLRRDISLLDNNLGYIKTKRYINQCDIVIAARMHCGVNAVSEYVPTIFLSYSEKSKGMAEYIYGSTEWVVELQNCENYLISKIGDMLSNATSISDYLRVRVEEIQNCSTTNEGLKRFSEMILQSKKNDESGRDI